jgi:hypothetical protein
MMYKTVNLHMARPYPKRAAGVAMINAIGGLSNLWASYLYYNAPYYQTAFIVCEYNSVHIQCILIVADISDLEGIICAVSYLVTITGYRWHVRKLNKLLAGTPEQQRQAMKSGVTEQMLDLNWRYIGY